MEHIIRVVLFDLGRTILYPSEPWPEILSLAYSSLVDTLQESGITECSPFTSKDFEKCLNDYYDQRNIDLIELTAQKVLKEFLKSKGCKDIPEKTIRKALDAMYQETQSNWVIEDDAYSTLVRLRNSGYQLGLISNAADDLDVQQLVDRWDLRPYFKYIITSASAGWRKPHPLIFQKALEYFAIGPKEVVMVGDTLTADIAGAENLGIYSIWITRRAQLPPDGELNIQPQAIISSLKELPILLEDLSTNRIDPIV